MKKTPIAVIGFIRCDVLEMTLSRIADAYDALDRDIVVYLSAPRSPEERIKTDKVLTLVMRFKNGRLPNIEVVQRDRNDGAGKNIRFAISDALKRCGRVIVIEDDVLISKTFLRYMDEALELYKDDHRIWCVNGYKSPYLRLPVSCGDVFLTPRNMAWGWGIWADRWNRVDFDMSDWEEFKSSKEKMSRLNSAGQDMQRLIQAQIDGRIDTWDVNCSYHMVKNSLWAVEPRYSLTKNVGFNTEGSVHCAGPNAILQRQKYYDFQPKLVKAIAPDSRILPRFRYEVIDFRFLGRVYRRLLRLLYKLYPSNNSPLEICR